MIVASPTTLIGLLRTVAYGWQQETVAESARAGLDLGRELYERLGVFAGHSPRSAVALDTAVGAYNKAVGSFETRLLVTARKFPEHGATTDEPRRARADREDSGALTRSRARRAADVRTRTPLSRADLVRAATAGVRHGHET